jgi:hypothetical protein
MRSKPTHRDDLDRLRAPRGFELHLVTGNYGTHRVANGHGWLTRHSRYHVYFTPSRGSWLNLVERLFGKATEQCVRRSRHHLEPHTL